MILRNSSERVSKAPSKLGYVSVYAERESELVVPIVPSLSF